jgi:hypothetical protein
MFPYPSVLRPSAALARNFSKHGSGLDIGRLIQSNILGSVAGGASPQVIRPGAPNPLSGKVMKFGDSSLHLTVLDPKESEDCCFFVSCGLGGASSKRSLFESYKSIAKLVGTENLGVYSSLTDAERRSERYRKGLPYYYDGEYINVEESENFFEKVFKERFFDPVSKLKDPKTIQPLALFGFSIGHRENISHVNYLHERIINALRNEGKNVGLTSRYFEKLTLVNIGSPVSWGRGRLPKSMIDGLVEGIVTPKDAEECLDSQKKLGTEEEVVKYPVPDVKTINYRSAFDAGTAKPKEDFANFHCNQLLLTTPQVACFTRPGVIKDKMYVFGHGLVPEIFLTDDAQEPPKNNLLGHDLPDYADAIAKHPATMHPILTLGSLVKADPLHSGSGVIQLAYDPKKAISEKDKEILELKWSREIRRREFMKFFYDEDRGASR